MAAAVAVRGCEGADDLGGGDGEPRFFEDLSDGGVGWALTHLHEPARKVPLAREGLLVPPEDQVLPVTLDPCLHRGRRVVVMDEMALGACGRVGGIEPRPAERAELEVAQPAAASTASSASCGSR